ncbi:DUF2325 domain-containing protein [Paraburkholderia ribeironis]|uniref:DUF2325 domain-containing protein n=1 Tax=Paraburkholderia ribeironis TaxID=1247936 RepID=UPI00135659DC|nr:DUF2325 domain-containing protein [Paraburkholderia ribeironis]
MPEFTKVDRQRATDFEIHRTAVELVVERWAGANARQKALEEDGAYARHLFDTARNASAVFALWKDAFATGDIPTAYRALKTHPEAGMYMRQSAFDGLHMPTHFVGAANPADIRRPVVLEEERASLRANIDQQLSRLHETSTQPDAAIQKPKRHAACRNEQRATVEAELRAEIRMLREALIERDDLVALHTSRREGAEQRAVAERESTRAMRVRLNEMDVLIRALQAEASAMERAVQNPAHYPSVLSADLLAVLQGKRILYVGGRPGSVPAIRWIVEASGGTMTQAGGTGDCKGLPAASMPDADMVMFPVDCIDGDTMKTFECICERNQIACYRLRTASLASFVELIDRLSAYAQTGAGACSPRFCLRHG